MGGWAPFCVDTPDEAITDANRHVEVVLRWRHRVVDVKRLRDVDEVRVGNGVDDDVCAPVASFALLQQAQGRWLVHVPTGVVAVAQQEGRGAADVSGAGNIALRDGTTLTLDLGAHTLQVRTVARSRSVFVPAVFDALWANTGVLVAASVVALLAALWWHPADVDDFALEALQAHASTYRAVLLAPTPKDNAFLQRMHNVTGKVTAKRSTLEQAVEAVKHGSAGHAVETSHEHRSDEAIVADQMRALFGDGDGVGQVFGVGGSKALNVALNGVASTTVASLGPQLRGGGGLRDGGTGTISVGAIHTRGGKGDDAGYGHQIGGLGKKTDRDIISTQSPVCLIGALDPELVRRVVREHAGQVRYCYERVLSSTPGLVGRVSLQWTINAEGHVTASSIESTTMHNTEVEACLTQRVKTWTFPVPKGGGVVVVKYPFIFNRAGGQ
jgi:hypothetical protein